MNYKRPIFIAELCCNHIRSVDLAKLMIDLAKKSGVDIVKFQKRDIHTWEKRKPNIYNSPHPNVNEAFGKTYKEHRKFLEFSFSEHKELKKYCDDKKIGYSASVWDIKSAKQICSLNPKMIKVASPCNSNYEMLEWLCDNYSGEIHVSLGMTSKEDIDKIVKFFINKNRAKDLYLYTCTSGYPVQYEDMCILEINNLIKKYGKVIKGIGFSGHHIGTAVDISAYTLGATVIERHFTLDKSLKGTDQKVALTKEEFEELILNIDNVRKALSYKNKDVLDVEIKNKEKLKW